MRRHAQDATLGSPPRPDDLGGHALIRPAGLAVALGTAGLLAGGCGGPVVYRDHGIPASLAPVEEGARRSGDARVSLDAGNSELLPGGIRLIRAERAAPAPPFSFRDEAGTVRTNDAEWGRVVWIDLWADWCATCRAEFPHVQRMHARLADSGLSVLAVARHTARDAFVAAVDKDWIDFPVIDATAQDGFPFPYAALPTHVLIDRAGRVRSYWTGHRPPDAVETALRRLLAEPAPAPSSNATLARAEPPGGALTVVPRLSSFVVRSFLELPSDALRPGDLIEGVLRLDFDPGWYVRADPGSPREGTGPLKVRVLTSHPGLSFEQLRPAGTPRVLAGRTISVYSGTVEIPIWAVTPPDVAPGSRIELATIATIQACDATSCLLPVDVELDGEIWIADERDDRDERETMEE